VPERARRADPRAPVPASANRYDAPIPENLQRAGRRRAAVHELRWRTAWRARSA